MRRTFLVIVTTGLFAAGGAQVAGGQQSATGGPGAIELSNAWARRAPAMAHGQSGGHGASTHGPAGNGAVYVTISNRGGSRDALIGATTDAAATVELHETVQEGGVMKMRPRPKFELATGGRLEMKPGAHHIMLLGLTRDLKPGDSVSVTLTFEKAGQMTVEAPVR
jgi:copper(I)-binding protein